MSTRRDTDECKFQIKLKGVMDSDKTFDVITYSGKLSLCGSDHNDSLGNTMLRGIFDVDLLQAGQRMRNSVGMPYTNIFNYMESSLGVTLFRDSLRRRLRYRVDKNYPRVAYTPRLSENINTCQNEDHNLEMSYEAVGANRSLVNICCLFGE